MNQQLLNINGQYIKFFVTTNATLPTILKNSGAAVVHHNKQTEYNSIWIGGELIAGGWGFVKNTHDTLEQIAGSYEKTISSIIEKEKIDVKSLLDRYDQIIYGVDHDKWNLNNYLQKDGEYADASNTYIVTSLKDFGGSDNIKIKLSQIPLLLRKTEYEDIQFYDFVYHITFKHGLTEGLKTITTTSTNVELPVNSLIVKIEVEFTANFYDSGGLNKIIMNLAQYTEKLNETGDPTYTSKVQKYDTTFSQIFDAGTFVALNSNEIINLEEGNENWSNIIYNVENKVNTIYYSNLVSSSSNEVKYKIAIFYNDEFISSTDRVTYKVLPGKQQVVELVGLVNPTDPSNYKVISIDDDHNVLYDTINAIPLHNKQICNITVTGYDVGYMFTSTNLPTNINEYLKNAEKCKLDEKMEFTLNPNANEYVCLVLPAWYKIKKLNRINKDSLQEFNYIGYFTEIDKCYLSSEKPLYVTNNPYRYSPPTKDPYYGSYKSKLYIANISEYIENYIKFRIYTEVNEEQIKDLRVTSSFTGDEVNFNIVDIDLNEQYTIPDENFNETYWLNSNAFKNYEQFEWDNLDEFLTLLSNADLT